MFKTKEECEKYIVDTYGADYLKFDIITAIKVGHTIARHLGVEVGYYPSNHDIF
ncbi:hypothetical protein Q9V03_000725 [Salmonella enterica]|nr:hypothetical protein [Salmonella enterica]EJE7996362.1 hypothetical protein [Salmonella enterica]ELH6008169.1 hypothetical protein [Salmonella enterica]